ncbi:DUF6603 domain-containing protein [Nonomuraea longicatena]|uniref:DUF6603 domain-containing protein n=1 Tax=Nonomuraea longicatena TaxID=83682 RepID=A0ABN1PE56_9ACTN
MDLDALRAHVAGLGDAPTLSAADTALPDRLRDLLGTFPDGGCLGTAPVAVNAGGDSLTLSLTCAPITWLAVTVTTVSATVTAKGTVTVTLGGLFDQVEITSAVTATVAGQLTAEVRPVKPGAFAAALEDLGERFGGDLWPSARDGLHEFGFAPENVAGFDIRLTEGATGYQARSVAVVAALDVKGLPLQIALWLPDLRITGALREDQPLKVRSLLDSFGIPSGEVPGELAVSALSFAAALGDAYLFRMTVTGLWSIGDLKVSSLSLALSYDKTANFVAGIAGTVAIGSAVELAVSASKSFGKDGGWSFNGGLAPGTALGMTEVTSALSLPDLPEPLASLELTSLWFSHDTAAGGFDLTVQGDMPITDEVRASLGVRVTKGKSGTEYAGTLDVAGYEFEVVFDKDRSGTDVLVAAFRGGDDGVEIVLRDLVAHFSPDLAADVPDSLRIDVKDAKFVRVKPASDPARFLVGVDLSASVDLSRLPLVGGFLSKVGTLSVENLQVLYSSGDIDQQATGVVNGLLGQAQVVPLPQAGLKTGVAALADLKIGNAATPVALDVPPSKQVAPSAPKPAAPASAVHWISVQKKLGIIMINRVGVQYQHNKLMFALDAGVTLGPLSLTLDGLSVGSPLDKFAPTFDLSGLGISCIAPPVEISGALLHLPADELAADVAFQYDGAATIALPSFSLAAVGSYAQMEDGQPSLFVFAQLEAPLLEVPPVLITGLMAGFGFNRELTLPTSAAEVPHFPLLALHQQGPDKQGPTQVLDVLEGREPAAPDYPAHPWIAPREGSYWLALGVEFSVAEVVNAKVLIAAEFGQELALAVLGTAILQLPLPAESATRTYVYAELGLEAVIRPSKGTFTLGAQLSAASYVLTPACHLTGGFACAVWFGPSPNAGQFVVTLGGYHPAFQAPAYYPRVPRLGIDWAVGHGVSIKAEAYLAVTPSCAMAGGRLDVRYHSGPVEAWFTAKADLLVSWRPFSFEAEISVSIGASCTINAGFFQKTISVSVGADVELWGPPIGGTVTAHLACFTVTISFGSDRSGSDTGPLGWPEFAAMLPKPADMITIAPVSGLDKTVADDAGGAERWLVRSRDLRFFTQSAIPASHLRTGDTPLSSTQPYDGPPVDVRPMKLGGLVGEHRLKLYRGGEAVQTDGWTLTPRVRNLPASLWGSPPERVKYGPLEVEAPRQPDAEVVPGRPVGFDVQAPRPSLAASRGVFPLSEYTEDELPPGLSPLPLRPAVNDDFAFAAEASSVDLIGHADRGDARTGRDQVYAALAEAKLFTGPNDSLAGLANGAGHLYGQAPMVQNAGSRT